ncbi:unnamed protein product [Blepharisma stoltei]|uniref:RRM domain-containing protein n=1 Tax=Blepharisma stoltei TaxID=1481888 RepID=A0AAU9JFE8_9CILI|nr:unnamed protein product [Blepharisma stoltei]
MFSLTQKSIKICTTNKFWSRSWLFTGKINYFSTQPANKERPREDLNRKENRNYDCEIFVGNINRAVKEKDLLELFRAFGNPILSKALNSRSGDRTSYTFISFDDESQAKKSLKMNGVDFMGSPLKITLSTDRPRSEESKTRPENRDPSKCVYVGNLSYLINETLLGDLFSKFGKVEMIRLNPGRFGHKFAFVQFSNQDEAKEALQLHGKDFQGKTLNVKPAVANKPENNTKSG